MSLKWQKVMGKIGGNRKWGVEQNLLPARANDFFVRGLSIRGNTAASKLGFAVTPVFVDQLPGLHTLRVSLARLDFAAGGLNPPQTHSGATEIVVVIEGTLLVGFVASNQNNTTLFLKVLNPGDVLLFDKFTSSSNIGKVNAVAFAGLSSPNPGVITLANAAIGSKPPNNPDNLVRAFQVNVDVVNYLEKRFWPMT